MGVKVVTKRIPFKLCLQAALPNSKNMHSTANSTRQFNPANQQPYLAATKYMQPTVPDCIHSQPYLTLPDHIYCHP